VRSHAIGTAAEGASFGDNDITLCRTCNIHLHPNCWKSMLWCLLRLLGKEVKIAEHRAKMMHNSFLDRHVSILPLSSYKTSQILIQ
jgi:hypothetical protein